MRVTERDIRYRDLGAYLAAGGRIRHSDICIGQSRASDTPEEVNFQMQKVLQSQMRGHGTGRFQFLCLSPLAIAEVDGIGVVVTGSQSGADAGIHASREAHDGFGAGGGHSLLW